MGVVIINFLTQEVGGGGWRMAAGAGMYPTAPEQL